VLTRITFMMTFFLAAIVNCSAVAPSIVNSSPLYNGSIGVSYNLQLQATGGSGAPYTWALSSGSLPPGLTLTASGLLSGTPTSSKTYTFSLKASDAAGSSQAKSVSITVFSTAADNRYCNSGNFTNFAGMTKDGSANLPTSCFFTARSATPSPGSVITVPAGADLQSYIDKAVCGETLMLAAGASYEGVGFILPAKHCDNNHWITIRSNTLDSNLPAEGVRMTPCWAKVGSLPGRPPFACPSGGVPSTTRLAKLVVSPSEAPITISGDHYRLMGLEITRPTGGGAVVDLVQTPGATKVILDRIWMHGTTKDETTHGVQVGDGHSIAVLDSYLNDFHCIAGPTGKCSDAQAIVGGNDTVGGGTYKIVNNFLEAAGENILFGGGASVDIPGDIEVRRNHLYKPMMWNPANASFFGITFTVKNHYEMKNGTRALVEGNIMENTWGGFSQIGAHVLLTPKNQTQGTGNLCSKCYVTQITVRYNHMISGGQGVQIANGANDNGAYATAGNSDSVHDNLFENLVYKSCYKCTNYYNQIATGLNPPLSDILKNVTLRHNTFVVATTAEGTITNAGMLVMGGPTSTKQPSINIMDNIFVAGYYGPWTTGDISNCATNQPNGPLGKFNACWAPYSFTGNLITGGRLLHGQTTSWPSGNIFPSNQVAVEYVNLKGGLGGDYHLSSTSPYKRTASDGKDPGADIDTLNSYTKNVN
jgi:hypothetical protein